MAETIHFTKMEALGNDYIYIDRDRYPSIDYPALARRYSDPHVGIGGDGVVTYSRHDDESFEMHIYNKDGSEAEMCGNAIRCVAKLLYEEGFTHERLIPIHTGAGRLEVAVRREGERVTVARVMMGVPTVAGEPSTVEGMEGTVAGMGNPHFVLETKEPVEDFPLELHGPRLEKSHSFPEGVNVEVIRPIDDHTIDMRVWERGSGLTRACGTGACASAAVAIRRGFATSPITVRMPGGYLVIEWSGKEKDPLYMTGPATRVYEGELYLDDKYHES